MTEAEVDQIKQLVETSQHIVIMQADNPDADSLGSALALEHILGELGKDVSLYCAVDMPSYLRYLAGWDRVSNELPKSFDLSVIVDASTLTLFEKLSDSGHLGWVSAKPCIVLDHHSSVDNVIPFAKVIINDSSLSSTGELIYVTCKHTSWPVSKPAMEYLMTAILGDTQGLANSLAGADTYRVMAEFVDNGVDRPAIEELRKRANKMTPEILRYKGELIRRAELSPSGHIAHVTIPQNEISSYSPLYNPAPLIQGDLLQTESVGVAIVFKHYGDGKITGSIRCNSGFDVAADLAQAFGGGGHPLASGFKITDGRDFNELKVAVLAKAADLIDKRGQA